MFAAIVDDVVVYVVVAIVLDAVAVIVGGAVVSVFGEAVVGVFVVFVIKISLGLSEEDVIGVNTGLLEGSAEVEIEGDDVAVIVGGVVATVGVAVVTVGEVVMAVGDVVMTVGDVVATVGDAVATVGDDVVGAIVTGASVIRTVLSEGPTVGEMGPATVFFKTKSIC